MAAIQVQGLEGVKARMLELDQNVQQKIMRNSLRSAGQVMRAAVEERAPVRPEMPSGTALPVGALKSDITLSVTRNGDVMTAVIQPGKLTRHVARWVEYGHRLVRGGYLSMKNGKLRGRGKHVGNVPAHPFIRPAFEQTVDASVTAFAEELKSEIRESIHG